MGKRRGGNKLALKTGIVAKKQKTEDEVSGLPKSATLTTFSFQTQCPVVRLWMGGPYRVGGSPDNLLLLILTSNPGPLGDTADGL